MTESLTKQIDKILEILVNHETKLVQLERILKTSDEDINIIQLKNLLDIIDKKEKEIKELQKHRCITIKDLEEKFGKISKPNTITKVIRVRQ